MKKNHGPIECHICNEKKSMNDLMPAETVRSTIVKVVQKKNYTWDPKGFICHDCVNRFREEYIKDVLETDKGELSHLEAEVVKSMKQHELLTKNLNKEYEKSITFSEKAADRIATFGGSWAFIVTFGIIIVIWVSINVFNLLNKPFDPYPFILLNLILSCLAALQAPIIMMSQNRLEAKDRIRAEHDYRINLKAELEIRHLHEKIDHLIRHQWQRLLEIQQIQTDLMEDLMDKSYHKNNSPDKKIL